jgi:hypothetical protein
MPRKNRRAPLEYLPSPAPVTRSAAPPWSLVGGQDVREVQGDKEYRCPGCDHTVRTGSRHLVVIPQGDPDARRHWHTECWRKELRRLGHVRRSSDLPD